MVSCAFATTGTIEIANVRPINLHLIEVVLDAGSTRILKAAFLSESHDNFHLNVRPSPEVTVRIFDPGSPIREGRLLSEVSPISSF